MNLTSERPANRAPFVPLSVAHPKLPVISSGRTEPASVPEVPTRGGFHAIHAPSEPGRAEAENCTDPKITLEREGDRVTRIKIQCLCGRNLELACEY